MPDAVDKVTIRNRTRQIASYLKDGGHLPAGLCDIEPEASFGATLLWTAPTASSSPCPRATIARCRCE